MSAPSEVKVRLDADLKKQFERKCRDAGTTMSAEINHMILAATERQDEVAESVAADPAVVHSQSDQFDRTEVVEIPVADAMLEQLEELLALTNKIHADRPQTWFDHWYKTQAAPAFATLAKQNSEYAQAQAAAKASQSVIETRLDEVVRNTRMVKPRIYEDYRIWSAFGAGVMALVLLLALLPGETAPSRLLARKIVGGKNDVHAAGIMAGGDSFHGNLIFETTALMKTEPFASDYARCVKRASAARKVTRCSLTFPALFQ